MPDKHDNFDENKLFERKNNHCGFRYCPLCGRELVEGRLDSLTRRYCSDRECGYVFYQNPIPASGAILIEDDKVLLVKRAHPPKIGWWCIPAGFMEWHEHPAETAVRELEEETGLKIRIDSFFEVYTGTDDPRSNAVLLLYLGTRIGGELRPADDALDVQWFSLDDTPKQIAFEAHVQALADINRRLRGRT